MSEQSLEITHMEPFAIKSLEWEISNLMNTSWDRGMFVLSHLDLRWPIIIMDDDLNIASIIDWE